MEAICTAENLQTIEQAFTGNKKVRLKAICEYLDYRQREGEDNYLDLFPTNVRHIYYKMISKGIIEPDVAAEDGQPPSRKQYQRISRDLTELRAIDIVPWWMISDIGRRTVEKRGVENLQAFIDEQAEEFLDWQYYHRCRVQTQSLYIEIVTEKEALAQEFENSIWPYCLRMTVAKGQNSATKMKEIADRMEEAYYKGKQCVILAFNDLDPSGWAIPKAMRRVLSERHGLDEKQVRVIRGGLNPEHIEGELAKLYYTPKPKDNNLINWIADFTDYSYEEAQQMTLSQRVRAAMSADVKPTELDALDGVELHRMITESIESLLDMSEFEEQMKLERREKLELKQVRIKAMKILHQEMPEYFKEPD